MKILVKSFALAALIAASLSPLSLAAGLGVFVNIKKTFLYTSDDKEGKVYHTSRIEGFEVLHVEDTDAGLMLLIEFPYRKSKPLNRGFVAVSENELKDITGDTVKVFSEIPYSETTFAEYREIPKDSVRFTGTSGESPLFKSLVWHNVNYSVERFYRFWVNADDGIYRPNGSRQIVNSLIKRIQSDRSIAQHSEYALRGIVVNGMSKALVLDILGDPPNEIENNTNNQTILNYNDQTIVLDKKTNLVITVDYIQ